MKDEIGFYKGKAVTDMDKEELYDVIRFLAQEVAMLKKELYNFKKSPNIS